MTEFGTLAAQVPKSLAVGLSASVVLNSDVTLNHMGELRKHIVTPGSPPRQGAWAPLVCKSP